MENKTDKLASRHLGKKSEGSKYYDKNLLVAIPRQENRASYGINNLNIPFNGFDIWHAYEFSCLSENGIPATKVIKLKYNCNSEYIVESKSLKLYFNSFNMTKFGKTTKDSLNICKNIIKADLSDILKTEVTINFLDNETERTDIFKNYVNISEQINETSIIAEKYQESPELLETINTENTEEYFLKYDSLRSNCRVTHQPDFGDIFIHYKSKKHILEDSLVKYLISFRSEYHFHEECCEMIYKRLYDILDESDLLFVGALYTRRGGIDICPIRYKNGFNSKDLEYITDTTKFARNGIKQ